MSGNNMISLESSRRYRTSPNFILRRILEEAVLVPVGDTPFGNSMITVNETFCFLWELFSEPITLAEAVRKAKEEYEDNAGEIEAHVQSFLQDCVNYGMISEED